MKWSKKNQKRHHGANKWVKRGNMSQIKVLTILKDGKWHTAGEILDKCRPMLDVRGHIYKLRKRGITIESKMLDPRNCKYRVTKHEDGTPWSYGKERINQ